MLENVLLVLGLDVFVVHRLSRLGIHPASILLALDRTIVVLDETHYPSHFDATLEGELSVCFHFPSSTRVTPRSNFGKTSDNDNLLEINHPLKVLVEWLDLLLPVWKTREVELDVGTGLDGDLLVESLAVLSIDNLVLNSGFLGDGLSDLTGLHNVLSKLHHEVLEIWDELKTTVQVSKDRLRLAKVDN